MVSSRSGRAAVLSLVGLCAAAAGWPAPAPEAGNGGPLRVMSFNIRYDNPADGENAWPMRREKAASMIRFHRADAVGLQEALRGQIADLEAALPDFGWFGTGRSAERDGEHCAVLFRRDRLEVLADGTFWLSETPEVAGSRAWDAALPRIVTWGRLRDRRSGAVLHLFNTHFDHRGETARRESARLLLRKVTEIGGRDGLLVVTGDFNATPDSEPYRILTARDDAHGPSGLVDALHASSCPHHGPTSSWNAFKAIETGRRIDWILVRPPIEVRQHGILSDTFDGRFPSDHLPVIAEVGTGESGSARSCGGSVAAPPLDRAALAAEAKAQFLHAWRGYERHAWGHDELRPLSKTPRDWYGQSLLTTPIDALDALILLGLEGEAEKAHAHVVSHASFDKDVSVKTFEITIRLLGGLLASHQLTGDPRLLALADDLGGRLLRAFDSPTGLPWTYVNLKTGAVREPVTNPAEAGTLLLEFGTLARLTGKPVYYEKAKKALVGVFERRSKIGLVGAAIDVRTGEWTERESHLTGRIDSYYEYLLKAWKLFGDEDCRRMWEAHREAIHRYLAEEVRGELWYGYADMDTGKRTRPYYGALDAFFPAVLVLDGDLDRAKRLQSSGFRMWQLHGLEPEVLDYRQMKVVGGEYHLRPEIIESAYYLHRRTGDPRYLEMGRIFLESLVKHCRTEAGFAAIRDVRTMEKMDAMESFLFAETLKYLYLLFAPDSAFDLGAHVLTTEAHPLKPVPVTGH